MGSWRETAQQIPPRAAGTPEAAASIMTVTSHDVAEVHLGECFISIIFEQINTFWRNTKEKYKLLLLFPLEVEHNSPLLESGLVLVTSLASIMWHKHLLWGIFTNTISVSPKASGVEI